MVKTKVLISITHTMHVFVVTNSALWLYFSAAILLYVLSISRVHCECHVSHIDVIRCLQKYRVVISEGHFPFSEGGNLVFEIFRIPSFQLIGATCRSLSWRSVDSSLL